MIKGSHHTKEVREKMRLARLGKYCGENNPNYGNHLSEETKEKLRIINLKENKSDETLEKMRKAHLGKHLSEITKKKISEATSGKNNPMYGKKHSAETKQKIRERAIGRQITEKTRKKMSKKRKGKKRPLFSKEWKKNISISKEGKRIGENNPNWKGGVTSLIEQIRHNFKYRQWRSDIFTRDNFTCQDCGDSKGGNLEAHHKKTFSSILQYYEIITIEEALKCEKLWDINNGITLCEECHKKIHRKNIRTIGGLNETKVNDSYDSEK